jgi:hypothetical protein
LKVLLRVVEKRPGIDLNKRRNTLRIKGALYRVFRAASDAHLTSDETLVELTATDLAVELLLKRFQFGVVESVKYLS